MDWQPGTEVRRRRSETASHHAAMAAFAASYPFVFKSSEGNGGDQVRACLRISSCRGGTQLVPRPLALHRTDSWRQCLHGIAALICKA